MIDREVRKGEPGILNGLCLFALGACLLVCAAPGAQAAETASVPATEVAVTADTVPAMADATALIEGHYRDLADLTATVVQKNYLKSIDKTQTFEGTLRIKRPGRLRLEYTNGQVIVIDGKEAWFYSKKNEQAIRRTFKDFEQANIPVAFLLGAADIRADFETAEGAGGDARCSVDLTPKRKDAAMKKIGLVCDEAGRIVSLVIHDRSGNRTTVVFSDVRENTGQDDKPFRFKVPKGTEIIEQ